MVIHGDKTGLGHKDFPAHLKPGRRITAQCQRNGANGSHILGDVFTTTAVTAGGTTHQLTMLIKQAHRQAIKLGLTAPGRAMAQGFFHPFGKGLEVVVGHGIAQRQHRYLVLHLRKAIGRLGTYPLGG